MHMRQATGHRRRGLSRPGIEAGHRAHRIAEGQSRGCVCAERAVLPERAALEAGRRRGTGARQLPEGQSLGKPACEQHSIRPAGQARPSRPGGETAHGYALFGGGEDGAQPKPCGLGLRSECPKKRLQPEGVGGAAWSQRRSVEGSGARLGMHGSAHDERPQKYPPLPSSGRHNEGITIPKGSAAKRPPKGRKTAGAVGGSRQGKGCTRPLRSVRPGPTCRRREAAPRRPRGAGPQCSARRPRRTPHRRFPRDWAGRVGRRPSR
jgi:hypothetical protein